MDGAQAQIRRCQRSAVLARGVRQIRLETDDGPQLQWCLRVDKLGLWAAGLETVDLVARIDDRTTQLSPAHKRQLQKAVDQVVRRTKGLPGQLTYGRIYGRLKDRYQVGAYAEIADEAFDSAMAYLQEMLRAATSGQAPEQSQLF